MLNRILYGPPGTGKTYQTWKLAEEIVNASEFKKVNELSSNEDLHRIVAFVRNSKNSEEFRAKSNSIYRNSNAILWMISYLLTPPHDQNNSLSKQDAIEMGFDPSPSSWSQRSQFISHFGFVNNWRDTTNLDLNERGKKLKDAVRDKFTIEKLRSWSGNCPAEIANLYKQSLIDADIATMTPMLKTFICALLMLMDGQLYRQDAESRSSTDDEKVLATKYFDLNPQSQDLKWIGHIGRIFQGLGLAEEDTHQIESRYIFRATTVGKKLVEEIVKTWSSRYPDLFDVKLDYVNALRLGRIEFVTFHQSYSYEEFVEGIKPKISSEDNIGYEIDDGILKRLALRASLERDQNFVLIIDEINRGNISRIFGDLITVIDPTKRKSEDNQEQPQEIRLTYSKELFGLPDNLFIIGTMNSADRSIANLDIALRRRFKFIEIVPNPSILKKIRHEEKEIDLGLFLKSINSRIVKLKNKEYLIGHSYFMNIKTWDQLLGVIRDQILPLLEEYFHGDLEKVAAIFDDTIPTSKSMSERFLQSYTETSSPNDFNDVEIYYFVNPVLANGEFHSLPADAVIKSYEVV